MRSSADHSRRSVLNLASAQTPSATICGRSSLQVVAETPVILAPISTSALVQVTL